MKKILFSILSFLMAYNLFKPSLFATNNNFILESSQDSVITSRHSSHSSHISHGSHSSHYSHYSCIYSINTDLINVVSKYQRDLLKKNLCNDSISYVRAFISRSEVIYQRKNKDNFIGESIFVILKEIYKENNGNESLYINFITIPLSSTNENFFCDRVFFDSEQECDDYLKFLSFESYSKRRTFNAKKTKDPWMYNL